MRRTAVATLLLLLVSCGDGGNNGLPPSSDFAGKCDVPFQKLWLRSWTNEVYLWYAEVPNVDSSKYADPRDYFAQLKTPAKTPSGSDKDRFHFWYPTDVWVALSQSGNEAGYGVSWDVLAAKPPRQVVAAYDEPNTPATDNNVTRGVQVLTVDNVDLVNAADQASVDTLNAGLFPAAAGEQHTFTVLDPGATTARTVTMTSQTITTNPVPIAQVLPGNVGYLLFNDHLATAEKALVDAVNQLKTAGVTDLILDIRYNGGGFLDVASELAYMIAGPSRTSGKTFELLTSNDKHPFGPIPATPFLTQAQGLSLTAGTALPNLGLSRVFVITGSSTCSASESVMNSLSGVDLQLIQIGSTTCGKPYAFFPQDDCGTTYFTIELEGVNAKGFGDYPDGFTPGGTPNSASAPGFPGCKVADDFGHALGDPAEAELAAALTYQGTGSCPAPPVASALEAGGLRGDGVVIKSAWRQNRILRR